MARHSAGLHLREIEERLFRYLFEYKVATSRQIARDVYPGISHQALYKRLNLLIERKYLQANYFRELGGRLVYSLDRLAFEKFIRQGERGIRKEYRSASPLHDLDLLEVGERLRHIEQAASYRTENVLRSMAAGENQAEIRELIAARPDGAVQLRFPEGTLWLAIEYERSLKYGNRYPGFFRKYYAKPTIGGVLLIGRDEPTVTRLRAIEKAAFGEKEPKVFYSRLDQLTQASEALRFTNHRGEHLILR